MPKNNRHIKEEASGEVAEAVNQEATMADVEAVIGDGAGDVAVAEGVVDADEEHEIYNDFEKNWRSTATFSIRRSKRLRHSDTQVFKTVNERMSGSNRVGVWVCVEY